MGGYLLLPSSFNVRFVGLPQFDKQSVPIMATFVLCLVKGGTWPRRPVGWIMISLALAYLISPIATTFGNSYELRIGGLSHPGYYLADGLKRSLLNLIDLFGFFIGWRVLSSPFGRAELLKAIVVAVLAYSIPILFEVRFSPQLHTWVYGYFPHSFAQQMRWGGFRAVVFLEHGLHVALLVVMGLIACCVAARLRWTVLGLSARFAVPYLWAILVFCKSLGAIAYGAVLSPLVLFMPPKTWIKVSSALLLLVCVYPALRSFNLIPVASVMSSAGDVSAERSASLGVRVSNEDLLLKKALEKPAFGWGGSGRNRIFDPASGKDISITDGAWILIFGTFGWLGYLSIFGLITFPVLRLKGLGRYGMGPDEIIAAGLSIVLTANIVDALPNANITAVTYLIAGSLAGFRHSVRTPTSEIRATKTRRARISQ